MKYIEILELVLKKLKHSKNNYREYICNEFLEYYHVVFKKEYGYSGDEFGFTYDAKILALYPDFIKWITNTGKKLNPKYTFGEAWCNTIEHGEGHKLSIYTLPKLHHKYNEVGNDVKIKELTKYLKTLKDENLH